MTNERTVKLVETMMKNSWSRYEAAAHRYIQTGNMIDKQISDEARIEHNAYLNCLRVLTNNGYAESLEQIYSL